MTKDQMSSLVQMIGQAVASHLNGAKAAGDTNKKHRVTRVNPETGNEEEVQTTVPELLAELNDNLLDLNETLEDLISQNRKSKRKKKAVRVRAS